VDPLKGPGISQSWKRIANIQQEGGQIPVTQAMRQAFAGIGAKRKKKKTPDWRLFFLRKDTASLGIPPRRIIDPFWAAHQSGALRNIMINFERKMRGERI